jgi:hypothetical protein
MLVNKGKQDSGDAVKAACSSKAKEAGRDEGDKADEIVGDPCSLSWTGLNL